MVSASNRGDKVYRFFEKYTGYAYFSKFQFNRKLRLRLLYFLGLPSIPFIACAIVFEDIDVLMILCQLIGVVLILLFLGALFILPDTKRNLSSLYVILLLVFTYIYRKYVPLPGAGPMLTLLYFIIMGGYAMYAVKLYFGSKNNRYFQIVGSIASWLIALLAMGNLFKYMHWPGWPVILPFSNISSILLTLFVLVSLPSSGYLNWNPKDRRILARKLLIPWVFFLLLFAANNVLPKDLSREIFQRTPAMNYKFDMKPYQIEDENN